MITLYLKVLCNILKVKRIYLVSKIIKLISNIINLKKISQEIYQQIEKVFQFDNKTIFHFILNHEGNVYYQDRYHKINQVKSLMKFTNKNSFNKIIKAIIRNIKIKLV